jgi:hypothetical protein
MSATDGRQKANTVGTIGTHPVIRAWKAHEMTRTWMTGVLAGFALICSAYPSVAQEKGKTAVTELASTSQAALKKLYATVPLAKELGPKAHAILAVQQQCRQVRSRTAAESW